MNNMKNRRPIDNKNEMEPRRPFFNEEMSKHIATIIDTVIMKP